ncbi:hypothetical protein C8P66_10764 [Humitalea rosea]|uniref:Uncharacterized protein n=1 Tax=Humitalea rosea TaxID=990373 RepID=A0A2W7J6W0_9PROT|nr:hypothetical protein [Humitalea rosea]PZW47026.1 hypothetical protein C8P66_10764 [Humitalea rosea]
MNARLLPAILALGLAATPALAQTAPGTVPHGATLMEQAMAAAPTASHAMALGIGMFGGAVLGSVLINGGALAAAVGAAAGLAVGNYVHQHDLDDLD